MKLHIFGSCSGTEPMPERKHASVAIDVDDKIYWIDAGEGCSYTAHNMGIDLLKVKHILISHTHMDHVGGLGNLLWNIRKLVWRRSQQPLYGDIELYIPVRATFNGIMEVLYHTEGNFSTEYEMHCHDVQNGLLFDDGKVKVTAFSNTHLKKYETDKPLSFSYRIEAEGKSLVYSGDVGTYADLDDAIGDGCDAIIIETGHFGVDVACEYFKNKNVGRIYFNHHGREILNYPEQSQEKIKNAFGEKGVICFDTMSVDL